MPHGTRAGSGKKAVLRNGYLLMMALLGLATLLAYTIQESFSKRSVAIHREFVQEQETLVALRRNLWTGGILTRDYFLNTAPDRRQVFERQLAELRTDTMRLLPVLVRNGATREVVEELQRLFQDLWVTLEATTKSQRNAPEPYEFIQREVVPRRDAAAVVLRQLERANRDALSESEVRFSLSRSSAASSLLYLLGACSVAGALIALLSLRFYNHLERESAARFDEVSEAKRKLERLSARLMEIQEEERTKLSRELHDEIVQNLAVVKIELHRALAQSGALSADARARLVDARDLAERTMRAVRDISMLLRPSLLDDLGLFPALQAQAEEFTRRTGTRCSVTQDGLADDLPGATKTCVYRVVQEALRNCEKHSQATEVSIRLKQSAAEILVEVSDNGIGFAPPGETERSSPFHLGLLGMKERASSLHGSLDLDTDHHNGGAVVRLRLPLAPLSNNVDALEIPA